MSDTYADRAAAASAVLRKLDASDHADRLEQREQREELARSIAQEIVAAQRSAARADAAAATAPIRRSDFDRLSPAAAMAAIKSGRRIVD